ncbi:MAG: DUF4197 domain-containing protein [Saprospiraceae bacterium]|jgi:hypothetical protein|nr:DUF4197 domain-containing protein [Saprospiraceae bacterium]
MKSSFLHIAAFLISLLVLACSPAQIQKAMDAANSMQNASKNETGDALKQALQIGIGNGASQLSQPNGYLNSAYKILLPNDVAKIANKLKVIPGFNNVEVALIEKFNHAAEDAAKSAKPIFVDAIKAMTIQDAVGILMGSSDAATRYLENSTRSKLYNQFNPIVVQSLNKFGALDYYKQVVDKYNSIPLVDKLNPRIDDFVTNKALDGLFGMVQHEELQIRKDPAKRVTDLLRRVFAKQDR